MNYLIIIGLLFNSAVILANRYWKQFPNKIYLPCLIAGVACIIAGALIMKA